MRPHSHSALSRTGAPAGLAWTPSGLVCGAESPDRQGSAGLCQRDQVTLSPISVLESQLHFLYPVCVVRADKGADGSHLPPSALADPSHGPSPVTSQKCLLDSLAKETPPSHSPEPTAHSVFSAAAHYLMPTFVCPWASPQAEATPAWFCAEPHGPDRAQAPQLSPCCGGGVGPAAALLTLLGSTSALFQF